MRRTRTEIESLKADVEKLFSEGFSHQNIADHFGLTRMQLHNFIFTQKIKHPTKRERTIAKINKVLDLYDQGLNRKQIADKLGLTMSALLDFIRQQKILVLPARNLIEPYQVDLIRELANQGKTQQEIADRLSIVRGTNIYQEMVCEWMARFKIEPKSKVLPAIRRWSELEPQQRDFRIPKLFL